MSGHRSCSPESLPGHLGLMFWTFVSSLAELILTRTPDAFVLLEVTKASGVLLEGEGALGARDRERALAHYQCARLGVDLLVEVLPVGCVVVFDRVEVELVVFVLVAGVVVVFGAVVVVDAPVVLVPGVVVAPEDGVVGAVVWNIGGTIASPGFGNGLDVIPAINSLRPVVEPLLRYL